MTRTVCLAWMLMMPSYAADSNDLAAAIELPARAEGLRAAGVKPAEVAVALRAAQDKGLGADEAEEVFEGAEKEAKDNGPVDNFGAFVKGKLDEGLRGRELAEAIHEEHARQGKGKPPDKGSKGKAPDKGSKGKAPDKGSKGKAPDQDDEKGPSDDKGKGKGSKGKGKAK